MNVDDLTSTMTYSVMRSLPDRETVLVAGADLIEYWSRLKIQRFFSFSTVSVPLGYLLVTCDQTNFILVKELPDAPFRRLPTPRTFVKLSLFDACLNSDDLLEWTKNF